MKKVKKWLLEDWWLKIISIVLAFIIWFIVVQANNPTDTRSFSNIRVTLVNTEIFDENSQVYSFADKADVVNVTVRAPKSVLSDLKVSDIVAEADVSTMVDGEVQISYSIDGNKSVEYVKGDKEAIKLEIEAKERRYIQLETRCVGKPADDYIVGEMKADQNMIEISGPQSSIEKVSLAAVTINVNGVKNSLSANVEITLYDSDGKIVNDSSISKQVDYMRVGVDILETKVVTIYGSKAGTPADGYIYTGDFKINPAVIRVAGSPADISGMNRIMITDPVDINGAVGDVAVTYDLNKYLPDGLIFADPDFDGSVTATACVEESAYKTIDIKTEAVVFNNIPSNANVYVVSPADSVKVSFVGLQRDIDALDAESVVVTIDLSAWMAENDIDELKEDTYDIKANVFAGGSVSCPMDIILGVKIEYKE